MGIFILLFLFSFCSYIKNKEGDLQGSDFHHLPWAAPSKAFAGTFLLLENTLSVGCMDQDTSATMKFLFFLLGEENKQLPFSL